MKLPCPVAADLLPLYHDGVCSLESRRLVEEHLAECPACRASLDKLEDPLTLPRTSRDDLKPLEGIRAEWRRTRKRALWKGALGAALACLLLFGLWWGLREWRFLPVGASRIQVTELSRLSDGNIAFHLLIDDGKELRALRTRVSEETGTAYITPQRAVLEGGAMAEHYMSLNDKYYYLELSPFTKEQFRDPALESDVLSAPSSGLADFHFTAEVTRECLGTEKDHVDLWEEGMDYPAASAALEERYLNGWD